MNEKLRQKNDANNSQSEVSNFNSVTDHYHKIMGVPNKKIKWDTMPRILRWFGYFFLTIMSLGSLILLLIILLTTIFK